jgi:hypothetical protein
MGSKQGAAPMGVAYTGKNDNRLLSPKLWGNCPIEGILAGRVDGMFLFNDFCNQMPVAAGAEAQYSDVMGFADTGGTGVDAALLGGALTLSSDGDNEGAGIRTPTQCFQISQDLGELWYEARIKKSTIAATKHGAFLGFIDEQALADNIPIVDAGDLMDANLVGFFLDEDNTTGVDTVYKANGITAVTVKADAVTIAADTFVKLGMHFDGAALLTFYADGVPLADTKAIPNATGTDFPADVRLGLVFSVLNATATTPGSSTIDWWAAAQLG